MLGSDWDQLYLTVRMVWRVKLNVSVCAIFLIIGTFLLTFHHNNLLDSNDLQADNSISEVRENNLQRTSFKGIEILHELKGKKIHNYIFRLQQFIP